VLFYSVLGVKKEQAAFSGEKYIMLQHYIKTMSSTLLVQGIPLLQASSTV
jgi:hypothetical protein